MRCPVAMTSGQPIKSGEVVAVAIIGRDVHSGAACFGSLERLADNEVQLILAAASIL